MTAVRRGSNKQTSLVNLEDLQDLEMLQETTMIISCAKVQTAMKRHLLFFLETLVDLKTFDKELLRERKQSMRENLSRLVS